MVGTKEFFFNSQCLFIKFQGLVIFSLSIVYKGDIIICRCRIRMVGTKDFFENRQCLFIKFKSLVIFSLIVVYSGDIVIYRCRKRMVGSKDFFCNRQCFFKPFLCLVIFSFIAVYSGDIVICYCRIGWSGPGTFLESPVPFYTILEPCHFLLYRCTLAILLCCCRIRMVGTKDFSRIANAFSCNSIALSFSPLALYTPAILLYVVAVEGWSGPRIFAIANAFQAIPLPCHFHP